MRTNTTSQTTQKRKFDIDEAKIEFLLEKYAKADYKNKKTGRTHELSRDGQIYRCGCMRSSTVAGLLNAIDKFVK